MAWLGLLLNDRVGAYDVNSAVAQRSCVSACTAANVDGDGRSRTPGGSIDASQRDACFVSYRAASRHQRIRRVKRGGDAVLDGDKVARDGLRVVAERGVQFSVDDIAVGTCDAL